MRAACADQLCELFELILSGAEIDEMASRRLTALDYACRRGHYEIAFQLLDSGADPNVHESNSMEDTALALAAGQGHFEIVRLLVVYGADPNCYAGSSAVRAECYARWEGHHEIAAFLREQEDQQHRAAASKLPPGR